jgi:hypothetical protein
MLFKDLFDSPEEASRLEEEFSLSQEDSLRFSAL